ncbi:MAG: hypothetical protein Kow0088_07040 [Anaerolineales bacterium]
MEYATLEEPSVLDFIKSLFKDWRRLPTQIKELTRAKSDGLENLSESVAPAKELTETLSRDASRQPQTNPNEPFSATWPSQSETLSEKADSPPQHAEKPQTLSLQHSRQKRVAVLSSFSVLILALFAQASLEPPNADATIGIILYGITATVLLIASIKSYIELPSDPTPQPKVEGEIPSRQTASLQEEENTSHTHLFDQNVQGEFSVHLPAFGAALVSAVLAFLTFGGGDFNSLNLLLWTLSLGFILRAFSPFHLFSWEWLKWIVQGWQKGEWRVRITRWTVLLFLAALILLFFRFYRLAEVPPEMVSDHAEKLLDVADVLDGKWHIFFPRNTGREAFQMFLTAAMVKLFDSGLSFMSLKLGTSIAGLLTLVYIYHLGKEIANRRVGLVAMTLAGVSYWLNVITRVGLRFSLYPLFVAPTLYYLIRALRRPNAKDFILCGIFLGLGLHGYSPFRVVPLVVLTAVLLALVHRTTAQHRRTILIGLMIVIIVSFIVFLPLLRYALQNPEMFLYRGLTRLTDLEKPLDHPASKIFFSNLWKALIMFFWNNGNVWVVSIPGRPALSVVSAALFFVGSLLVFVRYVRHLGWIDLFLLVSIPLLLLPSILSLAFPDENPILNRTSGAIIPVFLLAALGLEALIRSFESAFHKGWQRSLGWFLLLCLLGLSMVQDYDLVFRQYYTQYAQSAWNTSQMGKIIHEFATTIGTPDTAWVVAYPYWVDTRLVGMNAGYPLKDYAIWPDQLQDTLAYEGAKLFIVKPEDKTGIETLQSLYPQGSWQEQRSPWEGKNFYLYFVPPINEHILNGTYP